MLSLSSMFLSHKVSISVIDSFSALGFDVLKQTSFLSKQHASSNALKWLLLGVGLVVFSAVPLFVELSAALRERASEEFVSSASQLVADLFDVVHVPLVLLNIKLEM